MYMCRNEILVLWYFLPFLFVAVGKNQTDTENAGQGVYSMDKMVIDGGPFPHTPPSGPYFDPDFTKNISVITGGKAVLNCRVYNIGNRTVSWIRQTDIKLLTVGRYTYTTDLRFEGIHQKYSLDWKLILNGATLKDSGNYECQVSTSPHISRIISLTVKDPRTHLLGGPEMYLDTFSGIVNLTCVIETLEPPKKVLWYHNETEVSAYQSGVSLVVDKSDVTTMSLLLQTITRDHSGIYECRPDNAPPASIVLHVMSGDKTAAQMSGSPSIFMETILNLLYLQLCMINPLFLL